MDTVIDSIPAEVRQHKPTLSYPFRVAVEWDVDEFGRRYATDWEPAQYDHYVTRDGVSYHVAHQIGNELTMCEPRVVGA